MTKKRSKQNNNPVILKAARCPAFMLWLICLFLWQFTQPAKAVEAPLVLLQNTVYIEQNDEYTLKTDSQNATGLVWTSSNTDVATVANGVVIAKKAGYTDITVCPADDTTLISKCRIVVKPKQVVGLQQAKAKSKKLTVTWKENKNCTGYSVYYRKKGEKEYVPVKQTVKTKATLKGLSPETGYDIRIATYVDTPEGKTEGTASQKLRLFTAPEIKGSTKITKITKGKLSYYNGHKIRFFTVQWKKVKGANSYRIYTQTGSKKPQLIDTVKKPQTVLYAALGYTYNIFVVPCRTKHGITANGKKSAAVSVSVN